MLSTSLVALWLILMAQAPGLGQAIQDSSPCRSTTVDDSPLFGESKARAAMEFLSALQSAVRSGDKHKVAAFVRFPLRVHAGKPRPAIRRGAKVQVSPSRSITNRPQFLSQYGQIMTPSVRRSIIQQSASCLFGNYQGVMIGNGQIWFDSDETGAFGIITVNVPDNRE